MGEKEEREEEVVLVDGLTRVFLNCTCTPSLGDHANVAILLIATQ